MTNKKTLTPAEALRALANGKKLKRKDWDQGSYIHLQGDRLLDEHGCPWQLTHPENFYEYTEPAPKVVWVEYLATPVTKDIQTAGIYFFREGHTPSHSLWIYTPTGRKMEV